MGKIKIIANLTLDGVMQGPGHPDEDTRGGFDRGGWAAPYGAMQQPEAGEAFADMGALLFGRHTYEAFYAYWPHQADNPFTDFLNNIPKYVVSTRLEDPPWSNSTLVKGDVPGKLRALKEELEQDMVVFGSGVLLQSLMTWGLVDQYALLIHPLVLGNGRRLFPDGGIPANLRLKDAKTTANGVIVATYLPDL